MPIWQVGTVSADVESYWDKECSVKELGVVNYEAHPDFEILLVHVYGQTKYGFLDISLECPDEDDLKALFDRLEGLTVVCHNAEFDEYILRNSHLGGWEADITFQCSADLAASAGYPRSLAGCLKHRFGIEMDKDPRRKARGKRRADFTDDEWLEYVVYCRQDTISCLRFWFDLCDHWDDAERRLSQMTRRLGWKGVWVNQEYVAEALENLEAEKAKRLALIPWVGQPCPSGRMARKGQPVIAGVASKYAFTHACEEAGIPIPPSQNKEDPRWHKWQEDYGERAPWAIAKSEFSQIHTHWNKFAKVMNRIGEDGRFPYSKFYHGAHTGRWTSVGGFNMENLTSKPRWGYEIRKVFAAPPGKKLAAIDFSQIEPRVLAWMTGNTKMLELMHLGQSPYEAFARLYLGYTDPAPYAETVPPDEYKITKQMVLSLGYQVGWAKYQGMLEKMGIFIPEHKAREVVADFRRKNPLITGFWKTLHQRVIEAYDSPDKTLELVLPSGRVLHYINITRKMGEYGWEYTGYSVHGGRRKKPGDSIHKLYGGLMCENVIQAIARDVLRDALFRVDKIPGVLLMWTVHDELICEVPLEGAQKYYDAIHKEVIKTPSWATGLPIAAEGLLLDHYMKT